MLTKVFLSCLKSIWLTNFHVIYNKIQAGYDSFLTGKVFLKLAHAIATFDSKNLYNIRPNNMNDYFLAMKPYENKVNLIKASIDYVVS
jgi:hypothetical protein